MTVLHEQMRRFTYYHCTVRLWIADAEPCPADEIVALAKNITRATEVPRSAAEAILKTHELINAVEVVDEDGNGTVVYRDWP